MARWAGPQWPIPILSPRLYPSAVVQGVAPELGQDTETILLDLGYSWEQIEKLHDAGVTSTPGRV